jgi:hypothetical protein
MHRILGVMNSTAYDTVNVISQMPPLELRKQQGEVKLFQKFVRWSNNFPKHNLTQGYMLWKEPTSEEILTSLNENTIVIFAYESCRPDPGLGGAGLIIQDSSQPQ